MAAASFDSLCAERDALRNYVLVHAGSLRAFWEEGHAWFRRQEEPDPQSDGDKRQVRHLTTTASCVESLGDVPAYDNEDPPPPCPRNPEQVRTELEQITRDFSTGILRLGDNEWQSESEKLVYSRVRTLPVVLRLAGDEALKPFSSTLEKHLKFVWKRLDVKDPRAQGIAEQPKSNAHDKEGYPPNAFHTYWAIRLLHEYTQKGFLPELPAEIERKAAVAQLWARRTLAAQTALISGGQRTFDAHQLAWALSTDVLCRTTDGDQPTTADRQHIELYDAALSAFFSQHKNGRWPLYEPLFHYSQAGNAYCYTYETLAELLRLARRKVAGRVLRDHLRNYSDDLIQAWHCAKATALELESGGIGWCSGHHPHRTRAEAWATASVFSYLQNLRCLIGYWAADEAKKELSIQPADNASRGAGEKVLQQRGDTWHRKGTQTVGRQLAMLYLHPLRATRNELPSIDPDRPLVDESRSAVLFGPPGTSKTTVVEGLATALGWDYVEVHASNFLSGGMDSIPKLADAIFQRLMELDHCVILFDEIDELIRLRDDDGSDPFGRFLTTSMLPKIAKLWAQRRVLFFVATNDIDAADPAIKRSQRFDATVFVPPPSFEKKKEQLEEILGQPVKLTPDQVEKALAGESAADAAFGVFALLRWDQIADLAHRTIGRQRKKETPDLALKGALGELGEELERTDWQRSESPKAAVERNRDSGKANGKDHDDYPHWEMFERWRQQKLNERRDYRNAAVLRLPLALLDHLPAGWERYGSNGHYLALGPEVEGELELREDGAVELTGDGWKAIDTSGIFSFESS